MEGVRRLIADLRQFRGTDTVVVFEPATNLGPVDPAALNRFAERSGLSGIGCRWREVQRDEAVALAAAILARDLAYGVQLVPPAEAEELAGRFAGVFAREARFFTNTDYTAGALSWGWSPLTGSTFDAGVLGVDGSTIGVLVVQDED